MCPRLSGDKSWVLKIFTSPGLGRDGIPGVWEKTTAYMCVRGSRPATDEEGVEVLTDRRQITLHRRTEPFLFFNPCLNDCDLSLIQRTYKDNQDRTFIGG